MQLQQKINEFQAYYTDAEELNNLMVSLLGRSAVGNILEPCAGKGAFVYPLLESARKIDAIDIDLSQIYDLNKIKSDKLNIFHGDFIDYFVSGNKISGLGLTSNYDAIICNPPYGLKWSVDYRKKIKSAFPQLYARESYGLFMVFGISCLRYGGRFVFIVPDTFLTSRNHTPLRKYLAEETAISHIVQFDSSRFETVNYGYGNMCIIAGNKGCHRDDDIHWADLRKRKDSITLEVFEDIPPLSAQSFLKNYKNGWISPHSKRNLFDCETVALGEIAECRTGIYTGDNSRFCAYAQDNPPKRINGHPIIWSDQVREDSLNSDEKTNGIEGGKTYVPFIRGGHRLPYEETQSALDWSQQAVEFYRYNKKSRLQNADFYFQHGLAVPMVTSGKISASLFSGAVFDQGVVGIFPEQQEMLGFMLVYLNSEQATEAKMSINPSANNSANYLKRILMPMPDARHLKMADIICENWRNDQNMTSEKCRRIATEFIRKQFATT